VSFRAFWASKLTWKSLYFNKKILFCPAIGPGPPEPPLSTPVCGGPKELSAKCLESMTARGETIASSDWLRMNADETQSLWFGRRNQLNWKRVATVGCWSQLLKLRIKPRRYYRQSVKHVRPCFVTLSGVLFPAALTLADQIVTDYWHDKDACPYVYQQPFRLLQQLTVWCEWRLAQESSNCSECCSSCHDRHQKVWPHHTSPAWTPLASSS